MIALRFLSDRRGATAVEFALVAPVAIFLMLGIIDAGRYAWAMNRLEKAVQMGVRTAVVTNVVASDLNTADYINAECPTLDADGLPTTKPIKAGDAICAQAVPTFVCTSAGCGADAGFDPDAFDRILTRMRVVDPSISDGLVEIRYSGSGIGFAGDPVQDDDGNDLSDAAPIVTVTVDGAPFRAISALGWEFTLPDFSYSQTFEDGTGQVSY